MSHDELCQEEGCTSFALACFPLVSVPSAYKFQYALKKSHEFASKIWLQARELVLQMHKRTVKLTY